MPSFRRQYHICCDGSCRGEEYDQGMYGYGRVLFDCNIKWQKSICQSRHLSQDIFEAEI